MTNKMMPIYMEIPKNLIQKVDELIKEGKFGNRSEAIRYFIRKGVREEGTKV